MVRTYVYRLPPYLIINKYQIIKINFLKIHKIELKELEILL